MIVSSSTTTVVVVVVVVVVSGGIAVEGSREYAFPVYPNVSDETRAWQPNPSGGSFGCLKGNE